MIKMGIEVTLTYSFDGDATDRTVFKLEMGKKKWYDCHKEFKVETTLYKQFDSEDILIIIKEICDQANDSIVKASHSELVEGKLHYVLHIGNKKPKVGSALLSSKMRNFLVPPLKDIVLE